MSRHDRHRAGYTAIELLVVLMILAVGTSTLWPDWNNDRFEANQSAAKNSLGSIHAAELTFRSTNADGDVLDDYATLDELSALGLIPAPLDDGFDSGYEFSVVTMATPFFEARANPVSCETGVLRMYVDPTGIVRYNPTQPAGPGDPELAPGLESYAPETLEQTNCKHIIQTAVSQSMIEILGLSQSVSFQQAIDLAATPGVADSIVTRLDANADEQLSMAEYVTDDLLAVARQIATELGDAGRALGADSDLTPLLESHQAWLASQLELDVDAPQPGVALLDLYGRQDEVVAYLQSVLLASVPAIGPRGLAALGVALMCAACWTLCAPRAGRRHTGPADRSGSARLG